ncbi:hypothetical protein CPB83DRAFT_104573 [Crepidotus variabilis]|uniref:Uncharacterized protein n=1 Tax=Crepidotus variabilis TaxID=179855 RepID=A0A9P6ELU0_9AGAR|nr:hypothetical protein CPB83DRAFT_104573 [Crepidotus variabilis]
MLLVLSAFLHPWCTNHVDVLPFPYSFMIFNVLYNTLCLFFSSFYSLPLLHITLNRRIPNLSRVTSTPPTYPSLLDIQRSYYISNSNQFNHSTFYKHDLFSPSHMVYFR